jgi:16S rRNA (adenine1518-N6/adenine1519-N6)-dimethyltransferase
MGRNDNNFMDLTDKKQLIEYLKSHGLYTKHALGQNFLVDRGVLDKIIEAAELQTDDTVIEVGPGLGVLSQEIVKHVKSFIAIEIDQVLAKLLEEQLNTISKSEFPISKQIPNSKIQILNRDILGVNLGEVIGDRPYKVVANIPYYITSKILQLFLESPHPPLAIVMLVQKEVAERICAKPGEMSTLAVSVQVFGEPEIVGIVPRESFFPAPEVDSAIIRITIPNSKFQISNQRTNNKYQFQDQAEEKEFFRLVHIGFASRRKTLANNLAAGFHIDKKLAADIIKQVGLSNGARAQELSIKEWQLLSANIKNQIQNVKSN